MAAEDLPREPKAPEDAEDVRVSLERLEREDSVSWESIKAKHELTDAELDALEDAEDLRLGLERLRRVKTEGTIPWEAVKAKYGL
ncbi:MAG: hypothetical protein F4X26_04025 [Chloroflexi bacterium]|nr:hypothetical protein [Chloroflexota bacterium]MYD65142.1 hypothetical protein [Chloroflexota bacterium]